MAWTLLTNDDGVESPALPVFARALGERREVRVVVPDRERSWVGKAITRFEPLTVKAAEREGLEMQVCSGYPADGVQLGIDGVWDTRPELVVSGINLGYNHGAGFLMSSGTVGAAVEAWVSGLKAIAFSTGRESDDWHAWRAWVASDAAREAWQALAHTCAALTDLIVASAVFEVADIVSVNLPFDADLSTPRRVTTIARTGYDRLFRHVGEGIFVHDFGGGIRQFDSLDGTDVDAAREGWISITPICMPQAPQLRADTRAALED